MDRLHIRKIITTGLLLLSPTLLAGEPLVNIISWWGYLLPELYQPIEKQCHVKISVDEYYSNPEFLRRVEKGSYDIAVYSDTVYQTFTNLVPASKANIQTNLIKDYQPDIKKFFSDSHYTPNTVYFQIALTGFLWNPKNITITKNDSIEKMFNMAINNTVVLLDEHVEILNLLSKTVYAVNKKGESNITTPTVSGVKMLVGNTNVIVTSDLGDIVKKPDFAFAYTWSGEAMDKIASNNLNYNFMVHPKLSHWSKDLLTVISNKPESVCVANLLGGRKYVNKLIESSYYFSPYAVSGNSDSKLMNTLRNDFYNSFTSLQTLPRISGKEYERLDEEWQLIKMSINAAP